MNIILAECVCGTTREYVFPNFWRDPLGWCVAFLRYFGKPIELHACTGDCVPGADEVRRSMEDW